MDKDKSNAGIPGEQEPGPLFSRNLEVSSPAPWTGGSGPERKPDLPLMKPADRELYFRIEARKSLEILRKYISGLGRDPESIGPVADIYHSWCTLWHGDDKFPVGPFSEMLEIVYTIFASAKRLSRRITEDETAVLLNLVQVMSGLVEGKANVSYLDSCRVHVEKARKLAGDLELESGFKQSRMPLSARGRSPEQGSGNLPLFEVSSSIDEWFEQVASKFKVEPGTKTAAEISKAEAVEPSEAPANAAGAGLAGREEEGAPGEQEPEAETGPALTGVAPVAEQPTEPLDTAPDVVLSWFGECCARTAVVINNYLERSEGFITGRAARLLSGYLAELIELSESLDKKGLLEDLAGVHKALAGYIANPENQLERESRMLQDRLRRLAAELETALYTHRSIHPEKAAHG
ncbi:MAG: hypothetical protein U9P14_11635 [Gemmatimonadota bacterium]|nr:hypothetical protein [Gemmatimonadota bacterium]